MNRKALDGEALLLLGVLYLLSLPVFSVEPPKSEEAGQIVALVDKAAALIKTSGKKAFPELRKKDSEWYKGDNYIFVDGMDGISLVNPPSPEIEGQDIIDSKDAKGKAFLRQFIETAKTQGSGWVEYWWPKPGKKKPSRKISYIKETAMPDGERVIVGAGFYVE